MLITFVCLNFKLLLHCVWMKWKNNILWEWKVNTFFWHQNLRYQQLSTANLAAETPIQKTLKLDHFYMKVHFFRETCFIRRDYRKYTAQYLDRNVSNLSWISSCSVIHHKIRLPLVSNWLSAILPSKDCFANLHFQDHKLFSILIEMIYLCIKFWSFITWSISTGN